jgi:hypothetical protein
MLPITCTSGDDAVLTWGGAFTVRGYHWRGFEPWRYGAAAVRTEGGFQEWKSKSGKRKPAHPCEPQGRGGRWAPTHPFTAKTQRGRKAAHPTTPRTDRESKALASAAFGRRTRRRQCPFPFFSQNKRAAAGTIPSSRLDD